MVQEAGFGHYSSTAALEKCAGDAACALELLARGWTPDDQDVMSLSGSIASLSSAKRRCPFAQASDAASPPRTTCCSITSCGPEAAEVEVEAASAPVDRITVAVQSLADRGISPAQIANLL